jgi:hypothetical protein
MNSPILWACLIQFRIGWTHQGDALAHDVGPGDDLDDPGGLSHQLDADHANLHHVLAVPSRQFQARDACRALDETGLGRVGRPLINVPLDVIPQDGLGVLNVTELDLVLEQLGHLIRRGHDLSVLTDAIDDALARQAGDDLACVQPRGSIA